jgi:DNA-binding NarL/FixJ family response regulator
MRRVGEGSGEQWVRSYLLLITGFALFLQGKHAESAVAACRSLEMKYQLGDTVGIAYCLETLGWLAAGAQRYRRTTWLLGAAEALWELAGSRVGGNAVMEHFHQQAADAAADALGADCYGTLMRAAARHPLEEVVALAVGDASDLTPPSVKSADGGRAGSLTAREREIAGLVAEGLMNREIAERLVISKRTVDAHVEHIRAKLGASSRVQIANWLRSGQRPSG